MVQVPVFVINGFLESGKTKLIKSIISDDSNIQKLKTLVIVCEEGELEYDDEFLDDNNVVVAYVNDQSELTRKFFMDLDKEHNPARVVIEFNAFFDQNVLAEEIPGYYKLAQNIAMIDASTFGIYIANMKQIFNSITNKADLIVFNRIEGVNELAQFRRIVRAFNPEAQIAFELENGQMTDMLDEDLPYDITQDKIMIEEDMYPIWYMDCVEHPLKYVGKEVTFIGKSFLLENGNFVPGRNVMTCCEDDIQFLGFETINESSTEINNASWLMVTATINIEYSDLAEMEVVILRAKKIFKLAPQSEAPLSL